MNKILLDVILKNNNEKLNGLDHFWTFFSLSHLIGPLGRFSLYVAMSGCCVCVCHREKPTYPWTGDFWWKSISVILAYI